MALTDYSIDTSDPTSQGGPVSGPNSVRRRQALADALLKQGSDTSPAAGGAGGGWITAANRALASVLGAYQSGRIDREERQGVAAANARFASAPSMDGMPAGSADTSSVNAPPLATGVPQSLVKPQSQPQSPTDDAPTSAQADQAANAPGGRPTQDARGHLFVNGDGPSPMDVPQDRTKMLATLLGEQPPGSPSGLGVANTIRNRAIDGGFGGASPDDVVQAPKQYSPWNDAAGRARMARALQNPDAVAKANDQIDQAYGVGKYVNAGPNDPTEGKTHFYDPASMVPVNSVPKWAQGREAQKIGNTLFFDNPDDAPSGKPVQVASADPGAIPFMAQPTQGTLPTAQQVAGQPQQMAQNRNDYRQWATGVLNNPYSNPAQRQVAAGVLQKAMTPKEDSWSSAGNGYIMNSRTGEVKKGYEAEDKPPASVAEYQYYSKNFKPTEQQPQPMDFATFSNTKARAGATNISNVGNVGAENKGLSEAAKLDAETVRKGQNEQMPALDDADHNFQIMQDAIDRNGGKLPTGGILGKLGLDARRTSSYIRENWGVDLGDDPTTATSLETFNKGGIKASGDMAKAIGGNRVLTVEFDMAQKANPGLETTDGGNKYLIDLNRNTIAIKRDHLQAQEDYWRDHNHSLDGFQKSWNAEVKSNPRALSNFSVAPPIKNDDGTQFVKLPSTGQGGYTWFRKGQDGLSPITDQKVTNRLDESAKPLKADKPTPVEKVVGDKTYIKQDGNWFEKPTGAP